VTALSTRYALPLLALLAIGLVPISLYQLRPRIDDRCASPETLRVTSQIPGTHAAGERLEERAASPGISQWSEGTVDSPVAGVEPLRFQIVRFTRTTRLYLRPTSIVEGDLEPERHETRRIPTPAGTLPVHVILDFTRPRAAVVAYFFVLGNEPSAAPLLPMVGTAFSQLVRGARPVTLYLVSGEASRVHIDAVTERAQEWLVDAFEAHRRACGA